MPGAQVAQPAGDKFIVNGAVQPYMNVLARKYRFRMLNSGPTRIWTWSLAYVNGSGTTVNPSFAVTATVKGINLNTVGIILMIVGAIEIIAGIIVFLKPSVGGYIVSLWLLGIIVNLLLLRNFYDIALRDLGLLLGALALARLGTHFGR